MGCDIHLHGELKIKGQWHHYNMPSVIRDYVLFSKMANVRNAEKEGCEYVEPIAEPRGLPSNISQVTALDAERWEADAHSHSWLSAVEIYELVKWMKCKFDKFDEAASFGYLFRNYWSDFIRYPNERPKGIEDVRFVFWFDN